MMCISLYIHILEKWFPLQGERAHSLIFLFLKKSNLNPNQIQIKSCSSFFPCLQGQPELCGATIFSSLTFLSSSVSMANLRCLVAASFSSLALFSSSISTANLTCLLVTTFSSLSFLFNSFSSPRFNLLRVARRCFSWSSASDDLFFPHAVSWFSFLLYLFRILSSAFLSSVLQCLKLCLL